MNDVRIIHKFEPEYASTAEIKNILQGKTIWGTHDQDYEARNVTLIVDLRESHRNQARGMVTVANDSYLSARHPERPEAHPHVFVVNNLSPSIDDLSTSDSSSGVNDLKALLNYTDCLIRSLPKAEVSLELIVDKGMEQRARDFVGSRLPDFENLTITNGEELRVLRDSDFIGQTSSPTSQLMCNRDLLYLNAVQLARHAIANATPRAAA